MCYSSFAVSGSTAVPLPVSQCFQGLPTEQMRIRSQEGGEERTFWDTVIMELRRAYCVAALKEITCLPNIVQMGTQSFIEIRLSLQKYSSSQKPAKVEDK